MNSEYPRAKGGAHPAGAACERDMFVLAGVEEKLPRDELTAGHGPVDEGVSCCGGFFFGGLPGRLFCCMVTSAAAPLFCGL